MRSIMIVVAVLALSATARPQSASATLLLSEPAIHGDRIAFVYDRDIWISDAAGSHPRRLTTDKGIEGHPRFSPDGALLAFHAEYDGNVDVYVVSVRGGAPRRLTWHPGADRVQEFMPDGRSVLFTSARSVHTRRHMQLFTVPVEGGQPQPLPIPNAARATVSPNGRFVAYNPLADAFRQWKHYRGGRASRIWVLDLNDLSVRQAPQPAGRCNDVYPMWIGDELWFLSDRGGEFNLMRWKTGADAARQVTRHPDFPIVSASTDGRAIVYDQAGRLHRFDPSSAASEPLPIRATSDLIETRARFVSGNRWIRTAAISPSGKRAVFGYRGEIVTVPAKKGDPRNLTSSPGVHERSPIWSPDGKKVAFFSDEGGEYGLHVVPQDGRGKARRFELGGSGFYANPSWSPDGRRIAFTDNSWSLFSLDLDSGRVARVAQEPIYGPALALDHAWSPDSRWLAYTRQTAVGMNQVWIWSVGDGRSHPVTGGLSDVRQPVFDANGKYLYFAGSTDAGPVRQWFAMSNADMRMSQSLYVAVLAADTPSPLAPESDEEPGEDEEGKEKEGRQGEKESGKREGPVPVVIDFTGLDQRILALPTGSGSYRKLAAGAKGKLFFTRSPARGGAAALYRFDIDKRKEERVASEVGSFHVTPDGKKLLASAGGRWVIGKAAPGLDTSKGRIPTDHIRVRIDPRQEWRQIFDEAWRVNRDYFYDPGMHGADWAAMKDRYAAFLPHLATRSDLNRVIRWMCSEIAVGHHRVSGGDQRFSPDRVPGGLLGADFEEHAGAYRFKRVYGGLNWNPGLRAPLTAPGVNVKAGEYLLAVNGRRLSPPENLFRRFESTAGRTVELRVAKSADGSDARTVRVVPIRSELSLRNRAWIEGNVERVRKATDGRVAYVYVPNTAGSGHRYFKRYFFPQADKEAIIVDERYNSGGQIADYVIDLLRRPFTAWWATRYGADLKSPISSIQGPKVMLIDETAGSGGDLMPWMFHKFGVGKLIGRPTWGGLVGILGFPVLMDGGRVTAPNLAIWTQDGFVVENVGVPPDIEVEQDPARVMAGEDPQLDRAIAEIMKQLGKEKQRRPIRPPFPTRARR